MPVSRVLNILGQNWSWLAAKAGGANEAGELGGIYQSPDGKRSLVKKEPQVAKNMAEFLGAAIFQAVEPDASAKVVLVASPEQKLPDETGQNVYVASIFVDDFKCDLYKDIYEVNNLPIPKERPKLLGLLYREPIIKAFESEKYRNFPQTTVPSLLIQDDDVHTGNLVVTQKDKDSQKYLKRIDYAAGFENFDSRVHPHSSARHLPGFGPSNHFKTYSEDLKINADFVAELDKVAAFNFDSTIDSAMSEMKKFYGLTAIKEFAAHIGIPLNQLQSLNKDDAARLVTHFLKDKMKARQTDLGRFAAQIKVDLCVYKDEMGAWKVGGYKDINGKEVTLIDVVQQHSSYFIELFNNEEHFKFRRSLHKNAKAEVWAVVKENAITVIADEVAKGNIIVKEANFPSHNKDAVIEALRSGKIHLEKAKQNVPAKEVNTLSLSELAFIQELRASNKEAISRLLNEGSNPNITLSDGSKLIDHCKDIETVLLLISYGAHTTAKVLERFESSKEVIQLHEKTYAYALSHQNDIHHINFRKALENGDEKVLKGVINNHKEILQHKIKTKDGKMVSPVEYAIMHNQNKAMEMLVESGAEFKNNGALHYAIINDNVKAAIFLIQKGASLSHKEDGKNPIELIKERKTPEMAKALLVMAMNVKLPPRQKIRAGILDMLHISKDPNDFANKLIKEINRLGIVTDEAKENEIKKVAFQGYAALKDRSVIDKFIDAILEVLGIDKTTIAIKQFEHTMKYVSSASNSKEITVGG